MAPVFEQRERGKKGVGGEGCETESVGKEVNEVCFSIFVQKLDEYMKGGLYS